ncbi:MAG TPA: hypothetical protein VGM56_11360 [Byssovorax sp.]|jgi:hypothetical protein
MALRNLSVQQMVGFTAGLLEKGKPARKALEHDKATKGLLESLEAAHAELVGTRETGPSTALTANLKKIQTDQAAHDDVHDGLARGAFHVLTGLAEIARARGGDDRTRELLDLRDSLFPQGLQVIKDTYADEASEAVRVAANLTKAQKKSLGALPTIDGRTLLDEVQGRFDAAGALGDLEQDKRDVETQLAKKTGVVTAGDVLAAQRRWMRAVKALVSVIDAVRAPDPALAELVVAPLAALEEAGDRRSKKKKTKKESGDPPGTPDDA